MNTATLKKRLDSARGPFASIYVDDSNNTEDSGKARELHWRTVLDELRSQGAPDELSARVVKFADRRPPIGNRGRALIVGQTGVVVDEELPVVPSQPDVRFSVMPHLLPLFEFGAAEFTILLAEVDRNGVDVSLIDEYGHAVAWDSEDLDRHPVHKAKVGDRFSWARVEERTEEMIERNFRDTAAHLTSTVEEIKPSILVISGEVQARTGIERLLPDHVRNLTFAVPEGGRADGADDTQLTDAIAGIVQQLRSEKVAEALERFRIEFGRSSGFAVDGIRTVAAHVQQANVDTLLVARPTDDTQPAPSGEDSRVEDAVLAATLRQGGNIVVCKRDDVKFGDGFGAILRAPALAVSDTYTD
ncbi:hypothetical protein IEU95_08815 [Hoyosella rhizosphaerae]|uniref:Peptide chain release factor 1 n=1 Tax=Hoyosella rhizosphaerae TaxID=1755582 RepID=A0A916U198_9ACTN|nr:hypothetical protein [Hoyosella rhizosphaerae]MBN4926931.1 hypothetical protein [Hoyosella rhizosphaerae]GGC55386.1 hypothetical protein GCM10011410_04720 [Hoyosella rhizosphaerae]